MVPQIKFPKNCERSAWYGTLGVSVETRQKPRSSCSLKQQMLISPARRVSHEKRKKTPKYYNLFELIYQNSKLQNIPPHLLLLIVVIINPNYCLWASSLASAAESTATFTVNTEKSPGRCAGFRGSSQNDWWKY